MGPAFKAPGFTYYTCWQRPSVLSGPSTALATGLFILTTLFGTPAHATIQLSKTIVSDRDSETGFSQIAGIMMSEAGTLYLTDSGSGRLVSFHPSAAARSVDLAAPNGAFRNRRLTGITGLGDSLIAVANAADDVIAVIDGAGRQGAIRIRRRGKARWSAARVGCRRVLIEGPVLRCRQR